MGGWNIDVIRALLTRCVLEAKCLKMPSNWSIPDTAAFLKHKLL